MRRLVTLARFASHPEARVVAGFLSAHGISAHVLEQDRVRFDPLRPGRNPGVRVEVSEEQAEEARQLLAAAQEGAGGADPGDEGSPA